MKHAFLIIMSLMAIMGLAGCSDSDRQGEPIQTPTPTPEQTPAPTPPSDFSGADFSGDWVVSAVFDSTGAPVTGDALSALEADFLLELLEGGIYFVYDAAGGVLGQGTYSVEMNLLTLTAGDVQTVYIIVDADTLHSTAGDDSITVMSRLPKEEPEEEELLQDEDDESDAMPETE